jgi:dihydrofolate reductase
VTNCIESALNEARAAAGGKDVKIGRGVATVRQYFRAGLVDEMHLALAPVLLGRGESLFCRPGPARAGLSRRRACGDRGGDASGADALNAIGGAQGMIHTRRPS